MVAVISVRVPQELKDDLKRYDVEVSEVTRKALVEEVEKRKMQELEKIAEELGEDLSKIPDERIVESIGDTRRQA